MFDVGLFALGLDGTRAPYFAVRWTCELVPIFVVVDNGTECRIPRGSGPFLRCG